MNTAISREGSGVGFAIPSSMLSHIFPSLKDGVRFCTCTPARAGLLAGDVLTRFDGKAVASSSALPVLVSSSASGQDVPVELWRNGKRVTKKVRLETRVDRTATRPEGERSSAGLGLSLSALTPELRQELGVMSSQGTLVSEVLPGSVAARSGLRPGDVISEAQGRPVATPAELASVLERLGSGQVVRLTVLRQGNKSFIAIEKP